MVAPKRQAVAESDLAGIIIGFTEQMGGLAKNVGEMSGQVREQIHISNNNSAKIDALGVSLGARLTALEAANHRRDGASNLLHLLLKSPVIAWLAAIAGLAWAFLTGRLK